MPSSVSSASPPPPSVGLPIAAWSDSASTRQSSRRDKRQEKLGLWSAVALQQHFTLTGGQRGRPLPSAAVQSTRNGNVSQGPYTSGSSLELDSTNDGATALTDDLRTHLGPPGSFPGNPHKPTLALRMGLVPPPPPAPSAEDWQVVVHRAMLREQQSQRHVTDASTNRSGGGGNVGSSASLCAICQMSFLSTNGEGQVILSCSHVFHARCFRAFELCVRAQQRADGAGVAEVTAQLACPVCRTQHYYKRVFYEGKAMMQRAAVVKVQSAIRGFLARRAYVRVRLRSNATFRTDYVKARLARLSAAWSSFCAQQERHREATLIALAVQHQAATAAYLTEEEWAQVWRKLVEKTADTRGGDRCARDGVERSGMGLQCPICLERIHETYFTQRQREAEIEAAAAAGDDEVAMLRLAYEQRQRASRGEKPACSGQRKSTNGVRNDKKTHGCPDRHAPAPPTQPRAAKRLKGSSKTKAEPTHAAIQLPHLTSSSPSHPCALASRPQSGVLLSCGHCFHSTCIGCYERYNEHRMTDVADSSEAAASAVVIADRCPICRAGYAKHPL
ncbi:hypothetical protein ABB37_00464 [Leptomonas pyrrhocoris]|uniref:RING-type domain-containing protein n=1 Tax=Leptomonas pyrrhocoris TaxID=157538 RepID=A0A0M9GAL9_LEPPY|nr:hypothetical protein ABB37_00464 [Leptomonas pyrrhocoris]KPA86229.1 hypothetical protein ABB37_00464 [Leptomonas pyrrhocoris]|eukprot:XP_015664668.1 hypothetical protein ABB37_00464 [Leptomonas pyrrhocoris]